MHRRLALILVTALVAGCHRPSRLPSQPGVLPEGALPETLDEFSGVALGSFADELAEKRAAREITGVPDGFPMDAPASDEEAARQAERLGYRVLGISQGVRHVVYASVDRISKRVYGLRVLLAAGEYEGLVRKYAARFGEPMPPDATPLARRGWIAGGRHLGIQRWTRSAPPGGASPPPPSVRPVFDEATEMVLYDPRFRAVFHDGQ